MIFRSVETNVDLCRLNRLAPRADRRGREQGGCESGAVWVDTKSQGHQPTLVIPTFTGVTPTG